MALKGLQSQAHTQTRVVFPRRANVPSVVTHPAAETIANGMHALHRNRRMSVAPLQARRRSPILAPSIIIGSGEDQMQMDLMGYLLKQRIIFVSGYVNDKMATQIVSSLLAMDTVDSETEIRMYINSSGGQPYSIFGVLDAMAAINAPIQTLALGCTYSYSTLLLAAGTPGRRFAMKNTRIMMTQPMGGSQGNWLQVSKTVEELNAIYQMCCRFYIDFTGMSNDQVEMNTNRDFFLTPEEAKDWNIIDELVRGKDDYSVPPSVIRNLKKEGWVDELSGGILNPSVGAIDSIIRMN